MKMFEDVYIYIYILLKIGLIIFQHALRSYFLGNTEFLKTSHKTLSKRGGLAHTHRIHGTGTSTYSFTIKINHINV